MDFEFSCFISYRRGREELMQTFTQELKNALKSYLEPYFDEDVFIDDEGLQGGDYLETGIAHALCKSVCMILVFVPKYFSKKHLYCTREFLAMEDLERHRFEAAGIPHGQQTQSFIIPIVFRDPEGLPPQLKANGRIYYDFSPYTTADPNISNNPEYVDSIRQIARRIYDLCVEFRRCGSQLDCSSFRLPSERDALLWLDQTSQLVERIDSAPAFPLRQGGR